MNWLVIGGDQATLKVLALCLQLRWPHGNILHTGQSSRGIELLGTERPDLVLIDNPLPDTDVLDLLAEIRAVSDVPSVVMLERQNEREVTSLFEMGADQCVTKPLKAVDLLARVTPLLRRGQGISSFSRESTSLASSDLTVNFTAREVYVLGEKVKLTAKEYSLLCELARNEGRVVTSRDLLERIWGAEYIDDSSFLKKYIHCLRYKLERSPTHPEMILTERGMGYKFVKRI